MLLRQRSAVVGHGHRQEVILDIRVLDPRPAADESARLKVIGGPQAVLAQNPAHADERLAERIHMLVQRDRLFARHLEIKLQVVLQVLTHSRQIVHHRNPERTATPPPAPLPKASTAAATQ